MQFSIRKVTNYIKRVLHSIIKKYGHKVRRTFREVNSLVENVVICQKQRNSIDCGVYVIMFARYLLENKDFSEINEELMVKHEQRMRKIILTELENNKLMKKW